jgi:REP element-mobilizing transposase RayT
MSDHIDPETGEVISAALNALAVELQQTARECEMLRRLVVLAREGADAQSRELTALRYELQNLRQKLATVDVPVGGMNIVGRLVILPQRVAIVVDSGRVIRLSLPTGWELPCVTGDPVSVAATLGTYGWTVWTVNPLLGADGTDLLPLDPALVERLSAPKVPKAPKSLPTFEDAELPKDNIRKEAHNASSLQLHCVFVRKHRGQQALTDEMVIAWKQHVADVIHEHCFGELIAIEVGSSPNPSDHLHFAVVKAPPGVALTHALGRIKAVSSGRLSKQFESIQQPFYSSGMFLSSAGGANIDKVKSYILNQNEDH